MPTYNFKRDSKLYLVVGGLKYSLSIYPDLSFSQTFNETNVPVKTLHQQFNMFEDATITKANPANFSFTIPVLLESDMNVILDLLIKYDSNSTEALLSTFDLYVESNSETYKLRKCVFDSGVFKIEKNTPISLSISGSASQLTNFTGTVPGTLQAKSSNPTFSTVGQMEVRVGGIVQDYITSVSMELRNQIDWFDFATLQKSLVISDASGTMFPEAFVVSSRVLSGTIQQYTTDTTADPNTWKIGDSLSVKVGNLGAAWTLEFALPKVVYTNRSEVQDIFIQSYDFRMTNNSTDLADIIKKRTI